MTDDAADLMFRPASELAALVDAGQLKARELVEASLARIEALNPIYNAFIDVFEQDALAQADRIRPGDGRPLAGVPIAIKNNRPVAGKRFTMASSLFGDFAAPFEWVGVQRLRDAGAIVIGSTNLPEFGIMPTTEPRRFGATRNPWDPTRMTGGSSGGSAAAVAAGMVPIAHANDGGGSTRIPAACCGLVGLKVQRGRISSAPLAGYSFLGVEGVVSRTVRDTAVALDVLAGHELGDVAWATPPAEPFAASVAGRPGPLRIARTVLSPVEQAPVDPRVVAAVDVAAEALRELGHEVVDADPPWRRPDLQRQFGVLYAPMISTQTAFAAQLAGHEPTLDDVEPLTLAFWQLAKQLDAVTYLGVEAGLQMVARELVIWSQVYDAVLCPTLAELPLPLGTLTSLDPDRPMAGFERAGAFTPFTPVANLTGSPAISLPVVHDAPTGLPIGVQLIGRPEGEATLLALGAQLERALPWLDRRPAVTG
jgi:amidase